MCVQRRATFKKVGKGGLTYLLATNYGSIIQYLINALKCTFFEICKLNKLKLFFFTRRFQAVFQDAVILGTSVFLTLQCKNGSKILLPYLCCCIPLQIAYLTVTQLCRVKHVACSQLSMFPWEQQKRCLLMQLQTVLLYSHEAKTQSWKTSNPWHKSQRMFWMIQDSYLNI